jgi:hypothetical protein
MFHLCSTSQSAYAEMRSEIVQNKNFGPYNELKFLTYTQVNVYCKSYIGWKQEFNQCLNL